MQNRKQHLMRIIHYRQKYNQTIADYDLLYLVQNGKCAVCGRPDNYHNQHFDIDHDHFTGETRGLLCTACNRLVGQAEHLRPLSEDLLKRIENYLTGYAEFVIMYEYNG